VRLSSRCWPPLSRWTALACHVTASTAGAWSRDSVWDQFVCRFWLSRSQLWSLLNASTYGIILTTIDRYVAVVYPVWYSTKVRTVTAFLPRDASAERGDATVSRLSVRLSVTIRYRVQIRWNSSKITPRPNSLRPMCWLTPNIGDLVQREHPQN